MIIICARCLNEEKNIERFLKAYSFADKIIISDGGSSDSSLDILNSYHGVLQPELDIISFPQHEQIGEWKWNPDNPHINYVIDRAKEYCKTSDDWIIMDDIDDVPNKNLQLDARKILESSVFPQVNVFRLYMWGEKEFFPKMNDNFNPLFTSLWAWKPVELNVRADNDFKHGTIIGLMDNPLLVLPPYCLLHYSWSPDTIVSKVQKYNDIGLPMNHPLDFAGIPEPLPEWVE